MTHIDVRSALRDSVAGDYTDLVTRNTGARVRSVIERQIAGLADGSVVFLDFTHIGILDRSCADEIICKLMIPLTADRPSRDGYVVFNGVTEDHLEIIEGVLSAHGLALVVQVSDGIVRLVGAVTDDERRCWEHVMQYGAAQPDGVAARTGMAGEACNAMLESLARRRLLRRERDRFVPLGSVA